MDNNYKDKNKILSCEDCKIFKSPFCYVCVEHNLFERKTDEKPAATVNGATINYKNWKKDSSSKCETCKHKKVVSIDFPCCKCFTGEMWESDEEEINSPSRYNKNGFECIEVMIAIFGKEAVRQFCKLNAFKYIWRESDKGKVNDIKKAKYYLKKYVELSSESSDKC